MTDPAAGAAQDFLYLVVCAANGEAPDRDKCAQMDLRALESEGVWYLPLKGIILAVKYPKTLLAEFKTVKNHKKHGKLDK